MRHTRCGTPAVLIILALRTALPISTSQQQHLWHWQRQECVAEPPVPALPVRPAGCQGSAPCQHASSGSITSSSLAQPAAAAALAAGRAVSKG
jgi:hypothetical protein